MGLSKWNSPFSGLEKWFEEDLPQVGAMWGLRPVAPVNVWMEGSKVMVEVAVAGWRPEDITIEVDDSGRTLHISGQRVAKEEKKDRRYQVQQISHSNFERTVRLPHDVKPEKAKAEFKDGILRVAFEKNGKGAKKRKIPVKRVAD
jgi:HSP20 family protein